MPAFGEHELSRGRDAGEHDLSDGERGHERHDDDDLHTTVIHDWRALGGDLPDLYAGAASWPPERHGTGSNRASARTATGQSGEPGGDDAGWQRDVVCQRA